MARKGRKNGLQDAVRQAEAESLRLPSASVPSQPKPRYGRNELVDHATRDRTISRWNRLRAMGVKVPGVSQKNIDTGLGARRVKEALRNQRIRYRI